MSASAVASRVRILATTGSGALPRNASLPSFFSRVALLLLGRGQVLGEPPALGGHVDGARQVERDPGTADRQRGGGVEALAGRLEPQQLPDRVLVRGQRRAVEDQFGGHLLAGLQALVGAEPADLGDDPLDLGDLRLGRRVPEAAVLRPGGRDQRLARR